VIKIAPAGEDTCRYVSLILKTGYSHSIVPGGFEVTS
jgi:hypothetical protein